MKIRLGEFLIKKNMLTQAQLEEALQAQVIFGGKLGTILIEMGLIKETTLADCLSQLLAVPCAQPGQLENLSTEVIKIISPDLAEKHKVIPVAVNGKKLTLAMADPHNLKSIDELSFRTGYIIRPILALEVRLVFALEEYYGIKRTMRYITPPRQGRDDLRRPASREPRGEPLAEPDREEDLGVPGSEQVYQKPVTPTPPIETSTEPLDGAAHKEADRQGMTLASTVQALVKVRDRNDVADAVIAYLGARYARAALFMVVADQVTGWRSAKAGRPIPGFDRFQMPLSEPSILQTAVTSKSFFLGPVQQNGANLKLTSALGKPVPQAALLLPMSMLGRVVAVAYVDDPATDLSKAVVDVQQLVGKALLAFEFLILQSKILRL